MSTQRRTLQEATTTLATADVIAAAVEFFSHRVSIYSAFVEHQGPAFVTLRGQGGEEIAIAAAEAPNGTKVTAATYMFDAQVSRFLATLPPVAEVA
ncbi:MAG: hypothetical protein U0163_06845 [Gemmatimonadaceae bacterium]